MVVPRKVADEVSWKWIVGVGISGLLVIIPLFGSEIVSDRRQVSREITDLRSRIDRIEVQFNYIDESLREIKNILQNTATRSSLVQAVPQQAGPRSNPGESMHEQ